MNKTFKRALFGCFSGVFLLFLCSLPFIVTGVGYLLWNYYQPVKVTDSTDNQKTSRSGESLYLDKYGIEVIWVIDGNAKVYSPTHKVEMTPAKSENVDLAIKAIQDALQKYPDGFVKNHISRIYILDSLTLDGADAAGTCAEMNLYLVSKGANNGYGEYFMEQTFHHEFAHELYYEYYDLFNSTSWKKINPSDFKYGTGGSDAIKEGKYGKNLDPALLKQGFVSDYSQAGIEEDFAEVTMFLFSDTKKLLELAEKYPRVKLKIMMVENFYSHIDNRFSKEYFEGL